VTVSRFFREAARWRALSETVLPELVASTRGPILRAWSVGCCAGEEPYTLALLWSALSEEVQAARRLEVLATDVDPTALARAKRRSYAASSLKEVPADVRARYFSPQGRDAWLLAATVARPVEFRQHDFMHEPAPPGRFDLVLCRYLVFTYYAGPRRQEAVHRLAHAVRPGGALMIGAKEMLLGREEEFFVPWPGAPGVYRRTAQRFPRPFSRLDLPGNAPGPPKRARPLHPGA
jgi:chemotaxis protein methyltransferase CheR